MRAIIVNTLSRFIRTTWLFSAESGLELPAVNIWIRRIPATESAALAEETRRRNVFARHSWENSFYLKRATQLADTTVIEVHRSGTLDEILPTARRLADMAEKAALLSSALSLRRDRTHSAAALSPHRRYGFDLAISPGFRYLRSSERGEVKPRGIRIDPTFVRRFKRCGFEHLITAAISEGDVGKRLELAVSWLFESRLETAPQAAVVKTAIALESLLIASDNESLRGPLSERSAFLLSDDPGKRRRVSKGLRAFYDLRSSIVHGGRRRVAVNPTLLEGVDRLVVLLLLTVGANRGSWQLFSQVVAEIENRRWGGSETAIQRPFPGSHLTRALNLCEGRSEDGAA
ncbi:MAG: hypothetical protein E8D47_02865 [Nitrospira sp.]|nr:MAG: hypothetical protein E8D47_02865 [Nitrospira sp.]